MEFKIEPVGVSGCESQLSSCVAPGLLPGAQMPKLLADHPLPL